MNSNLPVSLYLLYSIFSANLKEPLSNLFFLSSFIFFASKSSLILEAFSKSDNIFSSWSFVNLGAISMVVSLAISVLTGSCNSKEPFADGDTVSVS